VLPAARQPRRYLLSDSEVPAAMRKGENWDWCFTPSDGLSKSFNCGIAQEFSQLFATDQQTVALDEIYL